MAVTALPLAPDVHPPTDRSLDQLALGAQATVCHVEADHAMTRRLMAMGVCKGQTLQLVQAGNPLIFRVLNTRIGVSHHVARQVRVRLCTPTSCCTD